MKKTILIGLMCLLGLTCLLMTGCESPGDKRIEGPDRPSWMNVTKKSKEYFYFVGESDQVESETMARDDAEKRAQFRAAETLWGSDLKRAINRVAARIKGSNESAANTIQRESFVQMTQEKSKTEGIVRGEVEECVVQKWMKKDPATKEVQYYYRAYVLLKVSKNMVKELMADVMASVAQDARMAAAKKDIDFAIAELKKVESAELFE